ncbi:MAG: DUF58 domain-containing protein [Burkholderiales bacterium]|nr:DUF58 domain-containing protein [Burkholderiales bacterium]
MATRQPSPTPARPPAPPADALLRQLEWTVIRPLDGLLQGNWRTLWRGAGVDLADLREYQHHDDVRHIDWNVTARLGQPHVRQFHEDRDLNAWFLLDVSASVDFGSDETTKLAVSAAFVAVLARVITRHGNRVGALLYGDHVDTVLPPRASRLHVLELIRRMTAPRPPDARRATALGDLLRAARGVIRRRSLVFVVSDFISEPGWADELARLARRHDVVVVRLWDPIEKSLPAADARIGLVTLQDAETGEQFSVDLGDPGLRRRHAELAAAQEAALLEGLARSGADTLELATDDDLLLTLMRFADLRRQRARQRSPLRMPAALQRALPAGALR